MFRPVSIGIGCLRAFEWPRSQFSAGCTTNIAWKRRQLSDRRNFCGAYGIWRSSGRSTCRRPLLDRFHLQIIHCDSHLPIAANRRAGPVRDHRQVLPDAPSEKRQITIDQLLTHVSGLPNCYASESIADLDQAVERILELALARASGKGFLYTNDGYSLLGALAESASGRAYGDLLEQEIFAPSGMKDSGLWPHCPGSLAVVALSTNSSRSDESETGATKDRMESALRLLIFSDS